MSGFEKLADAIYQEGIQLCSNGFDALKRFIFIAPRVFSTNYAAQCLPVQPLSS
jgi:hypothetical protein